MTSGQLEISGRVFEQYTASCSNKPTKNTISLSRTLSVEYHLNQTHDSSVWPTFFLLCPINGSMEQEKSWIMKQADFPSTNSQAASWPACGKEFRKTGSTKWDMRHHCIWKCSGSASVSPWQKICMATQSKRVGQQKPVFFQCLL